MDENKKDKRKNIIILILVLIIALGGFFLFNRKDDDKPLDVDTEQSSYVKPETPVDRSKNVTLPGWGAFNIPANTKEITQGFEFHNPEENFWYVDKMSVDGKEVEDLVVDSGNKVELNHYLKLNGIDSEVKSVGKYDKDLFEITKTKKGKYQIEAIGYSDKTQTIKIKTKDGKSHKVGVESKSDCFYMTFALYLKENDELLYQSGLVSPNNYIQKMEITKPLRKGSYDAYIVIQPYRSDKKTKTNQGVVNLTLNASCESNTECKIIKYASIQGCQFNCHPFVLYELLCLGVHSSSFPCTPRHKGLYVKPLMSVYVGHRHSTEQIIAI